MGSREIARTAVRSRLAEVAVELFHQGGFDRITVNELAAAGGVSRSTFLRYFTTKEDAVLAAFEDQGDLLAAAIRARPAGEDDWTVLLCALLGRIADRCRRDPAGTLALTGLIRRTPALCARNLERQATWRPLLATALLERHDDRPDGARLRATVLVSAAFACYNAAVDSWTDSGGTDDLPGLVERAFSVMSPR
ncbi:TetR family transcriptional regulator [Actinoplanes sp. NPDC051851]|uniref:TetR/AcrR family transcriptional regulator n=1 Tax=Actinoplanes sp. NPDC051851 TaxID=3154753 RepID=UPI0034221E3B